MFEKKNKNRNCDAFDGLEKIFFKNLNDFGSYCDDEKMLYFFSWNESCLCPSLASFSETARCFKKQNVENVKLH